MYSYLHVTYLSTFDIVFTYLKVFLLKKLDDDHDGLSTACVLLSVACQCHTVGEFYRLLIMLQIVPSVHGIYFKDLKQTLRKEQCDVRIDYY